MWAGTSLELQDWKEALEFKICSRIASAECRV